MFSSRKPSPRSRLRRPAVPSARRRPAGATTSGKSSLHCTDGSQLGPRACGRIQRRPRLSIVLVHLRLQWPFQSFQEEYYDCACMHPACFYLLTSPNIENAFSNNSFVTNGDRFFTFTAALWGADLTLNVRPFNTLPSSSRLAFSELYL